MANERKTEQLVRSMLNDKGYYSNSFIVVEEQASDNPKIDKLLKLASKGGKGKGYPEFIISFKNNPNHIILIECKAETTFHESKNKKHYKDYAVDGVLLYSSYLKDSFNVTAIAVSGQNEREKKVSSFLWLKEHYTYKNIQDKTILAPDEISNILVEQSKPITEDELIKQAIDYNSFLHKYSIPEVERCTLISAILIALQDGPFLSSYQQYKSNKDLIDNLIEACKRVLKENELDDAKTTVTIDEYSKFKNNVAFTSQTFYNKKSKADEVNTILKDFIILINENILPYINNSEFDVLGKFYTQFIRYAGSDKKTGLVLTPTHITDLFCEIADLSVDDIVFDECCGTAGFLVSAMNYMLKKAGNDSDRKKKIKSSQLLGIEARSDMFSHACSNMMMRGDGKSHILYGDCFKEENTSIIKSQNPTKAFLNPPYQDGNAAEQLEFIENALSCLVKDGICIAICQMSTTVSSNNDVVEVRERLLQNHTLEATFSMPTELFHPVGVNTSILIFKAHNPHPKGKKSFFGYFKDDGFVKTKNHGRIDKNNKWDAIKKTWLNAYVNKESIIGLSVMQEVTKDDEWCAEAYLETDYSTISKDDFTETLKQYVAFQFLTNEKD
jgi:type I restriction enzyme M protein